MPTVNLVKFVNFVPGEERRTAGVNLVNFVNFAPSPCIG